MHLTNYAINKNNVAFCQNLGGKKGKAMLDDDEESELDSGDEQAKRPPAQKSLYDDL